MGDFKDVAERFTVSIVSDDGGTERSICQVGLDGVFIMSPDGKRTFRKYPLNHISRWALRGNSLVLYTKTPVDVEERTVTLQADENTIRTVLDTLTCSCMQMCELLQSGQMNAPDQDRKQATNSLTALLSGGTSSKTSLPTADEVEFWNNTEKTGWMLSQGEHIRNWRRRWFVLKQGYLFRFANQEVSSWTKPRGIVDLSKVTDVAEGRDATGKPNSIKLATATGQVCYLCDSETEQVEWMSALETAVTKLLRKVAGVETEPAAPGSAKLAKGGGDYDSAAWAKRLEREFESKPARTESKRRTTSPSNDKHTMVSILSYDQPSGGTAGGSTGHRALYHDDLGMGDLTLSGVSGIAGIRNSGGYAEPSPQPGPGLYDSYSSVKVDYPGYPVLQPTPSTSSNPPSYPSSSPYSGAYASYGKSAAGPSPSGPTGYAQQSASPQQGAYHHQPAAADLGNGGYAGYGQAQQPQTVQQPGPSWQTHYTPEGKAYYHNPSTGVTQWEPPSSLV